MNRRNRNLDTAVNIAGGFVGLVAIGLLAVALAAVQYSDARASRDQVAAEAQRQYCQDVALWIAEEARNVPLAQRVGQPDYRGTAAEQCPAIRHSHLLELAQVGQRQPVRF
ncbi:hypothetical protein [Halomonas koreensis]|uniref:Uncharacterized protein n=1 Tax=Halomonas koreensis TaxID=245385 RepID=A0ABU1G2T7_9GAMM|nr:hypothetical protein [Halomonas koreensis]MDR5867265.1 hypothetical protein [Halomonas koreensis]